jgi:hypothetical protein
MPFVFKHEDALRTCQTELQELIAERERIERRIMALRQTLVGLMRLKNDVDDPRSPDESELSTTVVAIEAYGLTEACRNVIRLAKRPMTPTEIKQEIEALGVDFSHYVAKPLSAVHQVLGTLKKYNEIEVAETTPQGTRYYRWKGYKRRSYDRGRNAV